MIKRKITYKQKNNIILQTYKRKHNIPTHTNHDCNACWNFTTGRDPEYFLAPEAQLLSRSSKKN